MDPELIDSELIYAKTVSGEEAMLQRTRVVQRNLRMVLILVDGNATVAELCDKTGNAQLTQSALIELENDGFIERRVDEDSVWAHGRRLAQQIRARAAQPLSEFSTFGRKPDSATPRPSAPPRHSLPGGEATRLLPADDASPKRFSAHPLASPSSQIPSTLPPPSRPTDSIVGPQSRTTFVPRSEAALDQPADRPASNTPPRISLLDRWRELWVREPAAAGETEGPDLKPLRLRSAPITWPLALLLGVVLCSGMLVLAVVFFPYSRYLPEVESALAASTGQEARVGEMRVTIYPQPGLLLADVRLGKADDEGEMQIAALRLRPQLDTLFSPRIVFHEMELSGFDLSPAAIARLSRLLASATSETAVFGVQQVSLVGAKLNFAGLGFADMAGKLALSADGQLQSLALKSADRGVQIEITPQGEKLAVAAEGLSWRPSPRSLYRFDSFSFRGEVDGPVLVIDTMDLRIFAGRVNGAVILRGDGPPAIAGEINFERINVKRFGEALGIGEQFEGDLGGDLRFSAMAESWARILLAVHAEGHFSLNRGSLGGIDLPEAVRRASATPALLGGATRFEQLAGAVRLTPDRYRFSRLALTAGTMQSSGQIEVSRDLQLRGHMDVQMRGPGDTAVPVAISGSLKEVLLQSQSR